MKFCPKCGTMLIPVREEDKTYLVCSRCGYKEPLKEGSKYKLESKTRTESKVKTTPVVSSEGETLRKSEELEQEKENYYEIFLELMSEEEGGSQ
ncbi:MAG: DNA-directed RNA polymerase subunit M [Zestosphaera sp.]